MARHIRDYHKGGDVDAGDTNDDAGEMKDDGGDDGADQTDDAQPEEAAEPKKRYGAKRSEPPAAAPVRRQRASAGDQGTQNSRKPKGKAACKKNQSQSCACRDVDSFSERNQELSEYVSYLLVPS